jgi:nitroreductase
MAVDKEGVFFYNGIFSSIKQARAMNSPVQEAISKRRSIREFTREPVSRDLLHRLVTAGVWAPSGLNNQPWRFVLVWDRETLDQLARFTTYAHIIEDAPAAIVVYLDGAAMYNPIKDYQSAGACIQNMLLAAEELGLGAVWLGQILQNKEQVNQLFRLDDRFELMAVVAVGHPAHRNQRSQRNPFAGFILQEIGGPNE